MGGAGREVTARRGRGLEWTIGGFDYRRDGGSFPTAVKHNPRCPDMMKGINEMDPPRRN